MPREHGVKYFWRTVSAFSHDVLACAFSWLIAFGLRFNLERPPDLYIAVAADSVLFVVALYAVLFVAFGLYRGFWRYASLPDFQRIATAVAIGAIAAPAVMLMLRIPVPRSVFLIHPTFLVMFMGGSRLAYRAWKERHLGALIPGKHESVFIVGAGDAAVSLIKEFSRSRQWRVVGVFDDEMHGRRIHSVSIIGSLEDIPRWAEAHETRHAIIAMPEASHHARRRAVQICQQSGLKVLTVPSYDDLISGRVTVSQVRHVELDDLLGRDPVKLDTDGLKSWLNKRTVMVTGAGGSIGAELCRQIARYKPARLVLVELSEFALYAMDEELGMRFPDVAVDYVIGDVKDSKRIGQLMSEHRPSVVFHAAAYKHVPLMETENSWQAILNNVRGTYVVADACLAQGIEKFVLVSTDKAVNPTNVMGASKRLAEMVCQALHRPGGTRFVVVRFGNVLGSAGSVIPKFQKQIARGGPITVTHPDITRYFMSIPEAAQLVLQAGLMGNGGEIFVMDMGDPVRIVDLARDMIRLSGLSEADIQIVYTGLRPGEKLYEELLGAHESTLPTPHAKLRIARARQESVTWLKELNGWLRRNDSPDDRTVKSELVRWVPEYNPADSCQSSVTA
jgi:FlaA1/EpsC-like NDP-sugar epimerase